MVHERPVTANAVYEGRVFGDIGIDRSLSEFLRADLAFGPNYQLTNVLVKAARELPAITG